MGVYYFFYNKTKLYQQNQHVLNGLFCDFVTGFDSYTKKGQKEVFEKCINLNNWNITDTILAVPDYSDHNIVEYSNKKVKEIVDHIDKDMFFVLDQENTEGIYNNITIFNKNMESIYSKNDVFVNNNTTLNNDNTTCKFEINNEQELRKILLDEKNLILDKNMYYISVINELEKIEYPCILECNLRLN